MTSPLQPLGNMVLMKQVPVLERIGLIWIPECAKTIPMEAEVVAVGPGLRDKKGRRQPLDVKPGDRVQLRHYFNISIEIHGEKYAMVPETEIQGVIG